jgi:hypothetical protein
MNDDDYKWTTKEITDEKPLVCHVCKNPLVVVKDDSGGHALGCIHLTCSERVPNDIAQEVFARMMKKALSDHPGLTTPL